MLNKIGGKIAWTLYYGQTEDKHQIFLCTYNSIIDICDPYFVVKIQPSFIQWI